MSALYDEMELIALPVSTVIAGPSWHDEVYQKTATDEWSATGSDDPWTCRSLAARGPFSILRLGEDGKGGDDA